MDTHTSSINIDYAKCPPCLGLICIGVCPVGIIEQSKKQKPTIIDISSCTKCAVCINLCPTKAITLTQSKDK